MSIRITVPSAKPRNPFAAAGRRRAAGVHRGRDTRQQARRSLRAEMALLKPPSP